MPDKPLETRWVATTLLPALRRGRRLGRRLVRGARSRVWPRVGVLGDLDFSLAGGSPMGFEASASQVRGCDVVVLSVPESASGIPADYLDPLILAEQHSVPTVLVVRRAEDLGHPLAAVVTHLVTTDPELWEETRRFAGTERTALLDEQASAGSRAAALRQLTRVHTPVAKR